MRALVVTVVHHPQDSRIRYRQIQALMAAGWDVTYAAPFAGYGLEVDSDPAITAVSLPRSSGRRRLAALRAARTLLKARGPAHDVVLLHDPELLLVLPGLRLPSVVWDVHEDTAAAVTLKPWLPIWMRPVVSWAFARIERLVEGRVNLILAEYAYQSRFRRKYPVVPNVTTVPASVPPPDEPRVIYVGSLTMARGAEDMVHVARLLAERTGGAVKLELIGTVTADVEPMLRAAVAEGILDWCGALPNDEAMARVDGALAGLSLLHNEPNYRVSLPTKVTDYMAHGIPVVTTPLPLARQVVEKVGCGIVVPFGDPAAAADAIVNLWKDPDRRRAFGTAGHQAAQERFDWTAHADHFVAEMTRVARRS